jgi:hypothetical protein
MHINYFTDLVRKNEVLVVKPSKRQEFLICNESLCMTTWEMTIFIQKDMFIVLFILLVSGLHMCYNLPWKKKLVCLYFVQLA